MQRILTSLLLLPLVVAAVFLLPPDGFLLAALAVGVLAALELARIGRHWAPGAPLGLLTLSTPLVGWILASSLQGGTALLGADYFQPVTAALLLPLVLAPVTALLVLLSRTPLVESLPAMGILTFGSLYLALPLVAVAELQRMDVWWMVLLIAMLAANDSAAFYFGRAFGRRKMSPVISPNKTWVGAVAGFLAGVAATAAWSLWRLGGMDPILLVVGALTTVAAQGGDLVESMLKRGAGIKDSGHLLPGHGGILDRCDSYLLAAPVLLLALIVLGLETSP